MNNSINIQKVDLGIFKSSFHLCLIALGLLLASFTSCSPKEKKLQKMADSEPIITYTKERGRGTKNPVYTLELLSSKVLKYKGTLNVPVIGERIIDLNESDFETVLKKFKAANFNDFENFYKGKMRDLSLTSITFQGHKVTYQAEVCPKELGTLAKLVEGLVAVETLK